MIIRTATSLCDRVKQSVNAKPFEWFFALCTIAWGVGLGNPIPSFDLSPSYRVFASLMSELHWAVICFVGGFVRCVIITINGSWFRSATLRALASLTTLALWLCSTIAFGLAGTGTPASLIYALFFIFEFQCMLNAGYESGRSEVSEWARFKSDGAMQRRGKLVIILLFAIGYTRGIKASNAGHPH